MVKDNIAEHQFYDVIIVGAGAAGIGMGAALQDFGIKSFLILEKDDIGSSFLRWPKETRLLTPSFQSTQFGLLDLNAVAINTSPALSAGIEHLSGEDYAFYLRRVADAFQLPIKTNTLIKRVLQIKGQFHLETDEGNFTCNHLIWATGEFQYPHLKIFPGSELCLHTSHIESYSRLKGNEYLVIGGYESGMDAALNLAAAGKEVIVLEKKETASVTAQDPSVSLSFYTRQRIAESESAENIIIVENCRVRSVIEHEGIYEVDTTKGNYQTANPPVLAAGYLGGEYLIKQLFEFDIDGNVRLNAWDESTVVENLYLAGPHVRHNRVIFCFIYKFRQRFGIVAGKIAKCMGIKNQKMLEFYKQNQMYLDDLRCCTEDCKC